MAMGLETFLDKLIAGHADGTKLPEEERRLYLDEWSQPGALTGMLNWYRATNLVVPAMDEDAALPQWTHAPFPALRMPTLVIWGLKDVALLPVQLEGMDAVVPDLRIVTSPTAGHFIPWEEPGTVTRAIRAFLDETGPA
jgi:pimeloyl-ACP methyl ester carboxylesterase